jgi:transposase
MHIFGRGAGPCRDRRAGEDDLVKACSLASTPIAVPSSLSTSGRLSTFTETAPRSFPVSRGSVMTECMPRHRHQEFMKQVEAEGPKHLDLHVILDNYGTHKHASVQRWLKRNPRVQFHFIPTSSSWLNLVERWFRDLTDKAIRRGALASVDELIEANRSPKSLHDWGRFQETGGDWWRQAETRICLDFSVNSNPYGGNASDIAWLEVVACRGSKPLAPTKEVGGITGDSGISALPSLGAMANRVASRSPASSGIARLMSGKGAYCKSASVCAPRS